MTDRVEVAIVGAGPYGLSIAAHLKAAGVGFRIFGTPMATWREHMPDGMLLKSDGFASNLADPGSAFTLERYCAEAGIPYDATRIPVSLDTFRAYALAFQRRLVPEVDDTQVVKVTRQASAFRVDLRDGRHVTARRVVLAAGISHFAALPAALVHLPSSLVTHSSAHADLRHFEGRAVTVVGAGASAIDLAVLLAEAGARAVLVARRASLRFNDPPPATRTWWARLRTPTSPIGPGWKPLFCTAAPGVFYRLPAVTRGRFLDAFRGPAAGWPMKARFVGRVPALLGHHLEKAEVRQDRVWLLLKNDGGWTEHAADHVIAATGYRVDMRRLTFLSEEILAEMRMTDGAPRLSPSFETSIPGLFAVGIAARASFGPIMQFACGTAWTAARISRRISDWGARGAPPKPPGWLTPVPAEPERGSTERL
jgi:thioredoxin reductase